MELYWQKHCQLGLKETEEMEGNKGNLQTCIILQEKGRRTQKETERSSGLLLPSQVQSAQAWGEGYLLLNFKGWDLCQQSHMGGAPPSWRNVHGNGATPHLGPEGRAWNQRLLARLESNDICLARFWTCLGHVTLPSDLWFWNGNAYPLPVPSLYFGSM